VTATPVVPTFIQHVIERKAGALAYAPTRAPFGYRYLSYTWDAAGKRLTIRLHDKHYAVSNANRTVAVTMERFGGTPAACGDGNEKSYQVDGNKVFSAGGNLAWRCVRGVKGGVVKIRASGENLPGAALAILASSVRRLQA
jgi:hypothetical protein